MCNTESIEEESGRLTEEDYEKFCVFSKAWKDFFGLNNWNIQIHFDDTENEDNYLAYTIFVADNHRADIYLMGEWRNGEEVTDEELNNVAFHEMCEVLFARVRYLAEKRHIREGEVDSEIHGIIRILEATILRKLGALELPTTGINDAGREEWD